MGTAYWFTRSKSVPFNASFPQVFLRKGKQVEVQFYNDLKALRIGTIKTFVFNDITNLGFRELGPTMFRSR